MYPEYELDRQYEEGYVVRQGGVIRLSVAIKGKPIPICKWTKDGRDISHRAMIATYDDITELVIKEAHKDDTGTYDLVLENKCGRKAAYIKVTEDDTRLLLTLLQHRTKTRFRNISTSLSVRLQPSGEGDWPP